MSRLVFATLVGLAAGEEKLPSWLPIAGLGFLEGFTKTADLDGCIMGMMTPAADVMGGIDDIKKGIKERNVTDIEEGMTELHQIVKDLPTAMQGCKMEEQDVEAILKVLKNFHSLKDIIAHVKDDLKADDQGEVAAQFELMVRSFKEKQYEDFGKHAGQLLHRLFIDPESTDLYWGSKCSGSADPSGSFPMCYEGSAGALGVKEDVKVKLVSYSNGKGIMDLVGKGIEGITCTGKSFTKSGQEITPDISDCLPKVIAVKKVEYCSDQDTVSVTVKDSKVPIPVSASLKKVACASASVVV